MMRPPSKALQAKAEEFTRLLQEFESTYIFPLRDYIHELDQLGELESNLMDQMDNSGIGGIDTIYGRLVIVVSRFSSRHLELEAGHLDEYPDRSHWVWYKTRGWRWVEQQ